jgi:hypothetical protein
MLKLTISNLTNYPITALAPFASQEHKHSAPKWLSPGACCETSELFLSPQVEQLATLPSAFRKDVTLRVGEGVLRLDFRISISMPREAIWRHVSVPEDCPWRIYILKVRLFTHKD